MGDPAWANAADLETNAGRAARQDLLDEKLAEWTLGFDDYDLFHRLQAAGVPAAPVLEASRLFDDPHVQARGIYQPQRLFDDVGTVRFTTPFYRLPDTPPTAPHPPASPADTNAHA